MDRKIRLIGDSTLRVLKLPDRGFIIWPMMTFNTRAACGEICNMDLPDFIQSPAVLVAVPWPAAAERLARDILFEKNLRKCFQVPATSTEVQGLSGIAVILGKVAHKFGIRYFGNH